MGRRMRGLPTTTTTTLWPILPRLSGKRPLWRLWGGWWLCQASPWGSVARTASTPTGGHTRRLSMLKCCFTSMMMKWCLTWCPQMSADILGTSCGQCWKHGYAVYLYVHGSQKARYWGRTAQDGHLDSHTAPELCFTSTETVGLLGTGAAQDVHLDFHTAPELWRRFWLFNCNGRIFGYVKQGGVHLTKKFKGDCVWFTPVAL